MPRGAKKNANQHNSRHENGIVAPGKRVTKQKSNGHINGSADGNFQANTPPHTAPAVTRAQAPVRRTNDPKYASAESEDLDGRASGDLSEDLESLANGASNGILDRNHRKIDVNAAMSPAVHESGSLSLALTILWSCPIGDTLAILIFLLSLPPTILTLTNTLFAILTFMPPAASISSFPTNLNEVFQGSSGAPSLATIIATDIIGLVLWLVIWTPVQVLALELAQAVVATTLGGANSAKNKGSDHTIVCMAVVIISHVARNRWIQNRFFGHEWTVRLASLSNIPLGPADFFSDDIQTSRSLASWFRLLITLHILVQGIVHVVRRWYARRGHAPPASKSKKIESNSEGIPPASPAPSAHSALSEPTTKSSIPNARETKEKSNKKKRKQGSNVRSQQPLWAAFAATKVTVRRELDQSKILQEATGSNATDSRNLGDAPFAHEEGRVWLTQVHLNSFSFEASHFPRQEQRSDTAEITTPVVGTGFDRSKPFFIRVNGADWSSTVIRSTSKGDPEDESADQAWEGEVFGLSPSSSYICSFVRCEDGVEVFSTNILTPSSPPPDQEALPTAAPALQLHRPSSPTSPRSTLQISIAADNVEKSEQQARQKRLKRDHQKVCASMRKEIDFLKGRIAKTVSDDKAHHSRQSQWSQQSRQAEEAAAAMAIELDSIGCIPEEDQERWTSRRSEWEAEQRHNNKAQRELASCKESAQQEKAAAQGEVVSAQQKRDRLTARATKLQEQLQRLQSANAQGLDEKERRDAEMVARAQDRRLSEERSQAHKANIERSIESVQQNIWQAKHQIQMFINASNQQQFVNAGMEESSIPGSDYSGSTLLSSTVSGFSFPALGQTDQATLRSTSASLRHDIRSRSTSLLSNDNGGLNDFDDQDPAPPMPSTKAVGIMNGRKQSGSAGGSGIVRLSPANKSGSPVWN